MGNPAVYGLRRYYNIMGAVPAGSTMATLGNDTSDTFTIIGAGTVQTTQKLYWRDSGLYIYSSANGQLDIVADTTIALSGAVTTDNNVTCTLSSAETVAIAGSTSDDALLISCDATDAALEISAANANAVKITGANTTAGINISGANADGILISGANTTASLNITSTTTARAIMVGAFASGSNMVCTSTRNYPVGFFAKIASAEETTAELRSLWCRFRVDAGADVGTGGTGAWGSGLHAIEGNIKIYGQASTATDIHCWNTSGVWGLIEDDDTSGALVHFEAGTGAGVFAQCDLGQATTIASGATVCGLCVLSNSETTLTHTGNYAGIYIDYDSTNSKELWKQGILFASASCTTGIVIPANATFAKFIGAGTWNNWCEWDQVDEFVELLCETTDKNGTKPMVRFRLAGDADEASASGRMIALQLQTYNQSTNNVYEMRTLEIQSGIKGAATLVSGGTFQGAFICLEDLDNTFTGTGDVYWLELRSQFFDPSSAFNGESSFINISNMNDAAANVNSILRLYQGAGQAGVADYFVDAADDAAPFVAEGSHGSFTTDGGMLKCQHTGTTCYIKLWKS